jgi:hypothetical protein
MIYGHIIYALYSGIQAIGQLKKSDNLKNPLPEGGTSEGPVGPAINTTEQDMMQNNKRRFTISQ